MDEPIGVPVEKSAWDEAVDEASERMANDIKEDIDKEVLESVTAEAEKSAGKPVAPPVASDYLIGNTRQEGELYCDYRARLYWENRLKKQYFKGRSIWIGRDRGEIHSVDRLARTNRKRRKIEKRQRLQEEQGKRTPDEVICANRKSKKRFLEACSK